jgi:hypothetical protein
MKKLHFSTTAPSVLGQIMGLFTKFTQWLVFARHQHYKWGRRLAALKEL